MDTHLQLIEELHAPISDLDTLFSLLVAPLDALGLLPPRFRCFNTRPLPPNSFSVSKHLPQIQRALLTDIVPTWDTILAQNDAMSLVEQYFCPDSFSNALPTAGEVAINAYATLVMFVLPTLPQIFFVLSLLERLTSEYPIDRLYTAVFAEKGTDISEINLRWEDCVKNVITIPAKVGNALGATGKIDKLPSALENARYFNQLSLRCESLIFELSKPSSATSTFLEVSASLPALVYLFGKLVNQGVFPSQPPIAPSQPSFFESTLSFIRLHTTSDTTQSYSSFWSRLFLALSPSFVLQSVLTSLFSALRIPEVVDPPTSNLPAQRSLVRQEAALLHSLAGKITPDSHELWEVCTSLMISSREWPESYARVFVCWISGGSRNTMVNGKALGAFLEAILDVWSSPEHIKHSLVSHHRYTTLLFILTVSNFPPSSQYVQDLVSNPIFIKAISTYIAHFDPSIRRCGMLAAEVVAHLCGQKLDFGGWEEGDEHGKAWCRSLRQLVAARDVDAELGGYEEQSDMGVATESQEIIDPSAMANHKADKTAIEIPFKQDSGYDSDDSMTAYASPPSSRSSSPSSLDLAEIERDPTLNVGVKRVAKPMYLPQLAELLRGSSSKIGSDNPHEADMIDMALNSAEELIRKKRGYGTELDENAVNLVYALLSLQNNFDLESFSEKRQNALSALVACSPRKAPPVLVHEFFKNQYSVDQRFVALNALAMGAREIASLPIPFGIPLQRTKFPSNMLPDGQHQMYIDAEKADSGPIPLMMEELSKKALEQQREARADSLSRVARDRRLRIQKTQKITQVKSETVDPFMRIPVQKPLDTRFIDVASEFFIVPLINTFWLFMRDEQMREERTSHLEGRSNYRGSGTGLILNPLVLSHLLRTLAILVHASQNAPEWLAVIAPDSLELAMTLGMRPVSRTEGQEETAYDKGGFNWQVKEASLITSALELALIVLDGALEIDGGRTLSLEHTALVLALGDWAGSVFAGLENGLKVQGAGGIHEAKLSRAAAGVLMKVDELTSKWRRSMLDYTG
ncbi:telomere length regulation protein-domain-containing protein [Gymnopilus junonius]|uniref:Telomere length regulation protein-domain-containing protein n=1 Tax=Gymnopilus junonius TaxID=109634 RepID=A0A9P5NCE6_GYMJU|nr:telomere length regulation protein-domain-containing protein [Gymnopilus junonius]